MGALALGWVTIFGLAGLLPGPARGGGWFGARLFGGFALLLIVQFLCHLVLGLTLHAAAATAAALAAAGLVRMAARERPRPAGLITHPAVLLPLAAAVVIAVRGGVGYQPLAWDELTNWLGWMRQAVAAGQLDAPDFVNVMRGYTPGWVLALAYPNLMLGANDGAHAAVMPLLMHVAMLALVHDVVADRLVRAGWRTGPAAWAGWLCILLALSVEATWKLAPTNLLIEKPQIYALAACLFLALTLEGAKAAPRRAGLHLGLAFAAGYLVKTSMLAFAAPLLLLWLGARTPGAHGYAAWRQALHGGAIMAAVILPVWLTWRLHGAAQDCMANPLMMFGGLWQGGASLERATDLARRFGQAEWDYVRGYKFPLTVVAAAGLAAVLAVRRLRLLPLALGAYLVLYFGALYAYHLDCFGEYYFQTLNSIDRFTRVPLRVIHLAGLILPLLAIAPRLAGIANGRRVGIALAAAALSLGGWQAYQLGRSFEAMATRFDATAEQRETVLRMRGESERVAAVVAMRPELGRRVQMIAQHSDGYHWVIGTFYGLHRFAVAPQWSWGANTANIWMNSATPEQVLERLFTASLVWPVIVDGWMAALLAPHVPEADCAAHLTDALLVPEPATRTFRCLPKRDDPVASAPR